MPCRLTREEVVTLQVLVRKGVSRRQVARQLKISEGTVRYHERREGQPDRRAEKPFRAGRLAPVIAAWFREHSGDRPVNILELYEHLVRSHGYDGSYKSVVRYVRRRYGRPPVRTYRRVETVPGAQSQTDWGEYPRVDLGEGAEPLSAFVMALSHSRMPAIVWSRRKDLPSWLSCHNESFRRLGGIPAVNRIDNVRTAIVQGAGAWGTIHPTYGAYARTVGFHVDACPPRTPEAKGKTEAKVRLSRRLVNPGNRRYDGLEDLQAETDERVERWAAQAVCPATGLTVAESWRRELEFLAPLPVLPEPFDVTVQRPVHRDCMVHFEGRQYPVPFVHVGQMVEVRGCAGKVQIFRGGQLLREFPRHTEERVLVDPTCYDGPATDGILPPTPLGRMGRRLQEIYELPVEQRPVDLYTALAEVAR
jgi:transposase